MERRRRRTYNPPVNSNSDWQIFPQACQPAPLSLGRRCRKPTQRTLTELLTRLLVSHAGEPDVRAPAGSDADER